MSDEQPVQSQGRREYRPRVRARRRTWALGTLDRSKVWTLHFDYSSARWEVVELEPETPMSGPPDRCS